MEFDDHEEIFQFSGIVNGTEQTGNFYRQKDRLVFVRCPFAATKHCYLRKNIPQTILPKQKNAGSGRLRAMAIRKIGINCRSMTGREGYSSQQFESALERDLLDLLAFDLNVERCESQPIRLHYDGDDGEERSYTPDILIRYRRDISPAKGMPHILAEVKYREEYRERYHELKRRFRAARQYAAERGWRFCVFTEREIRTPYLDNARLLRPYRDHAPDPFRERILLERFASLGETTPNELLDIFDTVERARCLAVLWKLISEFRIQVDLTAKITMRTKLRPCFED